MIVFSDNFNSYANRHGGYHPDPGHQWRNRHRRLRAGRLLNRFASKANSYQ
jgi:hypothetical protein